ncbi:conserved hypothetical protein [Ricinus communis]|uniref:Uncharacterized protein n=1 Tax=Ricinus communis TaxID=3988 RepID=B9TGY0_RICCO|nr:conserved hypothetical protein [Ricinus communis]
MRSCSARARATESRMIPAVNSMKAIIVSARESIQLGMRNTCPVSKYSMKTGMEKPMLSSMAMALRMPKKAKGRVSFISIANIQRILPPSRKVESFECEPSGRRP